MVLMRIFLFSRWFLLIFQMELLFKSGLEIACCLVFRMDFMYFADATFLYIFQMVIVYLPDAIFAE